MSVPTGGSMRARRPAGEAAGAAAAVPPPPAPRLERPWSVVAVTTDGPEVALVARWMAEPHVASTWRQPWPVADWSAEIGRQLAGDHSRPWIVALDGEAVAYVEAYRVARDVIAEHHPTHAHDLGIHVAIGDVARTGRGLGARLLRVVAGGLLAADPQCRRVLGDPSVGHAAARAAFARAGFVPVADVDLGHKRAALMAHARADAPSPGGRP